VDAFASAGSRPSAIAGQLKKRLGENSGAIRVNEIRYVAQDGEGNGDSLQTQLATRALGADAERIKDWLNDPQKLLQLIAAAEGADRGQAGERAAPGNVVLQESDLQSVLRLLAHLGKLAPGEAPAQGDVREQLSQAPIAAQALLQQALANFAAQSSPSSSDPNLLVKVAEHLAIQFALERYEKGEVRVHAVRELLDRMGREIETLRKVLREHEEKMGRAGMMVESHADILDRQFWAAVPENGKRAVLLSPDAWCIPPRNVRDYVEQLLERGDRELAASVLGNYAAGVQGEDAEARRKTAMGLSELAELYGWAEAGLLRDAILRTGGQLHVEPGMELQTLLSATLVRLGQEAGTRADFPAIEQALDCAEKLERHRPNLGQDVRRRIGVENRLRKFIGDALRTSSVPPGFLEFLQREPRVAADELAAQYGRCLRREQCQRVVELAQALGNDGAARLTEVLRSHPAGEAVNTIALLSHLDMEGLREWLPQRLPSWGCSAHDAVVRQIAAGGVSERGRLLLDLLDSFDSAILPGALDEIGVSGDPLAAVRLLGIAEGDLPDSASPYLQVKAIEALARLRAVQSLPVLEELLTSRGLLGWKHPREIRIVAAQAILKLDPTFTLPAGMGVTAAELQVAPLDPEPKGGWIRHRRYPRIVPDREFPAWVDTGRGRCPVIINSLSLGGGKGIRDGRLQLGAEAVLDLHWGLRRMRPQVLVRELGSQEVAFEIIEIDLEDRSRLRRLLAEQMQNRAPGLLLRERSRQAAEAVTF